MSRFKTELCNNLIELGVCKYGDRCHYAHGAHELRQVSRRHPKYRTESCKNFELTGKCPFGPRCSYVHPKPDLDSLIEQLNKYVKHTKAPKPGSEDEEEDDDNVSLFTRTATSASLYSNCGSTSSNSNHHFILDEANKENQLVVNYPINNLSTSPAAADIIGGFKKAQDSKLSFIKRGNNETSNVLQTSSIANNQFNNQQQLQQQQQLSTPINQQSRVAMRVISSNSQQSQQEQESSTNNHHHKSTSSNVAASNPFGINNPLSDYFNNANLTGGNTSSPLAPNKQFYTRF